MKLAPAGVTARELIDEFCGGMASGHTFKAYLPGGASGGILPASMADLPLDFGTLEKYGCFVGSHAVVILSDKDDMKAVALNLMRFFEDESCGQCTPCRVGTEKAAKLMAKGPWDEKLSGRAVRRHARCLDLRPRPGGAQSAGVRAEVFPGRTDQAAGALVNRDGLRDERHDGQKPAGQGHGTTAQSFFIDDREIDIREGETIFRAGAPARHQAAAPVLHAQARLSRGRQLPRLHGGDRGRARAGGELHPHAGARHEGEDADRSRQERAPHGGRAPAHRPAGARAGARSGFRALEDRQAPEDRGRPLSQARRARARPQPSRDGGQSRRLHPLQSVRPRLPRGPGQRRDRHGRPRPSREDRVRFRRSDGRLDLRRMRRMRAGLSDRRADAGDDGGRAQCLRRQARSHGGQRVPLLRRRLPAHLSHQGRQARLCRAARTDRPTRTGCASRAASASTTSAIRNA